MGALGVVGKLEFVLRSEALWAIWERGVQFVKSLCP